MSDEMLSSVDDDLDSMLEAEGAEPATAESDFSVEGPAWQVSREELLSVFHIVDAFPAKTTVFFAFWKEGNSLHVHSNNKDVSLDVSLALLNESPYETDKVFFVDYKMLAQFVQTYQKFAFTFDDKGSIYYKSSYTEYKLELFSLDIKSLRIPLEQNLEWHQFPLMRSQLAVLKSLYMASFKLTDNKVRVQNNMVDAYFTLFSYAVKSTFDVKEPFVIRRIDIPVMLTACLGDLRYALTSTRLYVKFPLGTVSFLRLPFKADDFMYPESFASGEELGAFQLDVRLLRKALKLTNVLRSNRITFSSEGQSVYLSVGENATFNVGQGQLVQDFNLSTEIFAKVVNTVDSGELFLAIKATEKGVDLTVSSEDSTVVYSVANMSTGTYKRHDRNASKNARTGERQLALAKKGKLSPNVADFAGDSLLDTLQNGTHIPSMEEFSQQFMDTHDENGKPINAQASQTVKPEASVAPKAPAQPVPQGESFIQAPEYIEDTPSPQDNLTTKPADKGLRPDAVVGTSSAVDASDPISDEHSIDPTADAGNSALNALGL